MRRLLVALLVAAIAGCGEPVRPPATTPVPSAPVPGAPAPRPAKPVFVGPPIRVLYVEDAPRTEFSFLAHALLRATERVRLHTVLLSAEEDDWRNPPNRPDRPPFGRREFLATDDFLNAYDVLIVGDIGPKLLPADAGRRIHDFVARGGGLIVRAGPTVRLSLSTFADVLPVVGNAELEFAGGASLADADGFAMTMTSAGAERPFIALADDVDASTALWRSAQWRQYWSYPVQSVKPGASVLLEREGAAPRRPLVVGGEYEKGRVLFVGVDDLWRMRWGVGDRHYAPFWVGAIAWTARR